MDEEITHRISVDLDDNAGTVDLFVTVTGITPVSDVTNENDTSSIALDVIPSKLTEQDLEKYVRREICSFYWLRNIHFLDVFIVLKIH